MKEAEITALAEILREAAQAEIMPRFRRLEEGDVRTKSSAIDLVTEADEAAERHIMAAVAKAFPQAAFVGEEGVERDRGLLDGIAGADLAIVVDPIDGTMNFASGLPLFGVMAAVVARGETVAGIIHDPVTDDWAIAQKGGGAFVRTPEGASRPMRSAAPGPVDTMIGSVSTQFFPVGQRRQILANLVKVGGFCGLRNAAHEYRLMASGGLHFLMYNKLMPWDHLAGALMVREAGGHVARLDGSPYRPEHLTGGLMAAPDEESWQELRQALFEGAEV